MGNASVEIGTWALGCSRVWKCGLGDGPAKATEQAGIQGCRSKTRRKWSLEASDRSVSGSKKKSTVFCVALS